jgi:uncharacterized damage-inducible protein DinB
MDTLLGHVLAAARGYMLWMCKQLELPDPGIDPIPDDEEMASRAEAYLEHLLERWRLPLVDLAEEALYQPEYVANNGTHHLCIDVMLEHAVMHPIRHQFQLENLMTKA